MGKQQTHVCPRDRVLGAPIRVLVKFNNFKDLSDILFGAGGEPGQ